MNVGMIGAMCVVAMRQKEHGPGSESFGAVRLWTRAYRLPTAPDETRSCRLCRRGTAIHEYQSDSSSKRPAFSASLAAGTNSE